MNKFNAKLNKILIAVNERIIQMYIKGDGYIDINDLIIYLNPNQVTLKEPMMFNTPIGPIKAKFSKFIPYNKILITKKSAIELKLREVRS